MPGLPSGWARPSANNFAETFIGHLAEFARRFRPGAGTDWSDILPLVRRTIAAHKQFDADIWEEFSSIARAADLSIEKLLVANGLTDYRDYVLFEASGAGGGPSQSAGGHSGECSAFLVPASRAAGARPIVGQTWDMPPDQLEFIVVVHRKPSGAPETLGLTTAGCMCLIGMNSEGVAVGNNNLTPTDVRAGVNYLFTITRALRQSCAEDAVEAIESTPRMSGHNFYVADGAVAINVETSATLAGRTNVDTDVFVHTNHYLKEELTSLEFAEQDLRESKWRIEHLGGLFAGLKSEISMDDCWRFLSDSTRGDGAVCNEDFDGDFGDAATVATVVLGPGRDELYICAGGARTGRREKLTL